MTQVFKPIYVWAQALDNISEDDFYEITPEYVGQMQNMSRIQEIVSEMGHINENDDSKFTHILKLYSPDLQAVVQSTDGSKILMTFSTLNNDNVNRPSNIDVLVDMTNINADNFIDYAHYFYHGFETFCVKTQRNANVLSVDKKQTYFNEIIAKVTNFNLPENETMAEPIVEIQEQTQDNESSKNKIWKKILWLFALPMIIVSIIGKLLKQGK